MMTPQTLPSGPLRKTSPPEANKVALVTGASRGIGRVIALQLAQRGVRVNCICPAAVRTHVTEGLIASGVIDPEKLFNKYLIKRFASVEEIAELVAYLCSDAARYVTGANWEIDGGYCAI